MDPINHFEIPYDDKDRAQTFYHDIFGWRIETDPDMGYTMVWTTDKLNEKGGTGEPGVIGGGMVPRENAKIPMLVITVKDIEASLKKIEEMGGKKVHGPDKVGEFGLYAHFQDCEGNLLGIWQNLMEL